MDVSPPLPPPLPLLNTTSSFLQTLLDLATQSPLPSQPDLSSYPPYPHNTTTTNISHYLNGTWGEAGGGGTRGGGGGGMRGGRGVPVGMQVQVPVYVAIFVLSVVGNVLVVVTLAQNKKMRTVTNVFLLNLAVSDLLLAVFCMPFTIIPLLLRSFVFGEVMCVLIRYVQGLSVAVSCFTLVAISLERYFAICRPLQSRSWQTRSHAYRSIAVCWLLAAVLMLPVAVFHQLKKMRRAYICVELWEDADWEKAYTVLINLMLLLLPVLLMSLAYGCVCYTLWAGIRLEARSEQDCQRKIDSRGGGGGGEGGEGTSAGYNHHHHHNNNGLSLNSDPRRQTLSPTTPTSTTTTSSGSSNHHHHSTTSTSLSRPFRRFEAHRAMRQSNSEKSRAAKKRVIKMLFMIVIEFFVFWTPVYVIGTWIVFDRKSAVRHISPMVKSLFHLLSYVSACCNPITYCFMNSNFRQGFLAAFRCLGRRRHVYASRRSEFSFSGHTLSTRGAATCHTLATTTYDKIRDSDDVSEKSF
ncbi:cholecystokinin receptor type A-like [Babylonia areolata]|uniref:cholecystokinin receptor type A-like n=1 Tax=Babylonia areolata TaxID=304850 RepID=UPI003FD44B6B